MTASEPTTGQRPLPAEPPIAPSDQPNRVTSLDALRAFAVAGVLAVHFSPTASSLADWGGTGVRLFFVLSGYLITGLLFDARARMTAGLSTLRAELGRFFLRRILRLGPAYYAALLGAVALNVQYARESVAWHAAFLSNYYVLHLGHWPALLSHFWTLAVEFQFYLVWPFAVLLAGPRLQRGVIVTMIVVGPLTRWAGPWMGLPPELSGLPFPACLDMFGWGAAIAVWRAHGALGGGAGSPSRPGLEASKAQGGSGSLPRPWFVPAAVGVTTFFAAARFIPATSPAGILAGALNGAAFAALVAAATRPAPPGWARWLSRCRPLVYLGTISYGIYLYHNFMHWLAPRVNLRVFGRPYLDSELAHVAILVALTLVVSIASWHFWERPIMRLRPQHGRAPTR